MTQPRRTPWGREIQESTPTTPWGRPRGPLLADFTEVGLSEADATAAAEGLKTGEYLSFEHACLSQTLFGDSGHGPLGRKYRPVLDESLMREKALAFARRPKS